MCQDCVGKYKACASIIVLIGLANVFAYILTAERIPQMVANSILSITDNRIVVILLINVVLLFVGGPICKMFGADAQTLACTVQYMPRYAWGFIIMSVNTLISAYLYSTKRTKQAVILNVCRSSCSTVRSFLPCRPSSAAAPSG